MALEDTWDITRKLTEWSGCITPFQAQVRREAADEIGRLRREIEIWRKNENLQMKRAINAETKVKELQCFLQQVADEVDCDGGKQDLEERIREFLRCVDGGSAP